MKIEDWYCNNYESRLSGRYITQKMVLPLLAESKTKFKLSVVGSTEKGSDIHLLKIGNGKKVFLGWSQMHGNESTTTKAIFDFLKFLAQEKYFQNEIQSFLNTYSFYIIPILNPDGAKLYTRENANGIDLNRDAQNLTQLESRCLRSVFEQIKPEGCLNLHDQRTIFGFDDGKHATISFLSPAANPERSITDSRKVAMEGIVRMNQLLQNLIPGQVGRYDDSFNSNCVGDTFQMAGVPTILFEAGHYKNDYQREKTRELIFYSFLAFFNIIGINEEVKYKEYFKIPENRKNYRDVILRNLNLPQFTTVRDVAVQYNEVLKNGEIVFESIIDEIGALDHFFGHNEKDAILLELLTKADKNLTNGVKVSEIKGL